MTAWYQFPDEITNVPRQKGVYLLSLTPSLSGVIYVGRADNLQERVRAHPDPANPCLQRKPIRYFAYEVTEDPEDLEQDLIDRYDPDCNRT